MDSDRTIQEQDRTAEAPPGSTGAGAGILAADPAAAALAYRNGRSRRRRHFTRPVRPSPACPRRGLDRQEAVQRLQAACAVPIELHYQENTIYLSPDAASASPWISIISCLPAGRQVRRLRSCRPSALPVEPPHGSGPCAAGVLILRGAAAPFPGRYCRPLRRLLDLRPPGACQLQLPAGGSGIALDIDASIPLIQAVRLPSPGRQWIYPPGPPPSQARLPEPGVLLQQIAAAFEQPGGCLPGRSAGRRAGPLRCASGREPFRSTRHCILRIQHHQDSIPASAFRRDMGSPSEMVDGWLQAMFAQSSNEAADALMKNVIDPVR